MHNTITKLVSFSLMLFAFYSCTQKSDSSAKENTNDTIGESTETTPEHTPNSDKWETAKIEKLEITGYFPVFVDNQSLLYTTQHYKGLWVYNLDDGTTSQLTDMEGAGYRPVVSGDTVTYQAKLPQKHLVRRLIGNPKAGSKIETKLTPENYLTEHSTSQKTRAMLSVDLTSIEIKQGGETINTIAPNGRKNYLNPSLSPNGQALLYEVSGDTGYVATPEGTITDTLTNVDAPQWVDNENVLYTIKKDDGMQITSSEVYIQNLKDNHTFQLTKGSHQLLENPSLNKAKDIIAVNSPKGELFLIYKNK